MTHSRIRKGLSYLIGESSESENHILPINAIKYSHRRNQLFTGGRDGVVKIWDATNDSNSFEENGFSNGKYDTKLGDLNENLLRLETSISSNPLLYTKATGSYQVLENYNLHFDWINDLQMVENDLRLVTCSSDLSLKLVNLEAETQENLISKFENVHTDYVKNLSYVKHQNQIVSGGLDGMIVVWDLNHLNSLRVIHNTSELALSNSIYSLDNDGGNIIGCGGPNNIINIFDKRLENPFIKKLIGHQDNVRCLIMNDYRILSGSSDSTIKLWDLRTFKTIKNFDIHEDPIWCLTSAASDFSTFYSADKSGNIVKTNLGSANINDPLNGNASLSTLVAKCEAPVMSLCVESNPHDEISLFASTDMNLSRFNIPKTDTIAHYKYLRNIQELENQSLTDDLTNDVNNDNDVHSDFYDLVSHLSIDTNTEMQSNFSLTNLSSKEELDNSEYLSMFLNVNEGGPSMEFVNVDKNNTTKTDPVVNTIPVEILLNPVRSEQITSIPFNKKPFEKYPLTPKSIIVKRMFNNKRWMLVLYLNGEIAIWDIFICSKLRTFPYEPGSVEMMSKMMQDRIKDMDNIYQEHQTHDTLNNWCEVDIKSGKLMVTLSETSFNNVEVYYDDLILAYPFLSIEKDEVSRKNSSIKITPDDRLQLSRILLNSIFHKYALYEWEFDSDLRERLKNQRKIESSSPTKDAFSRIKMFSRKTSPSPSNANSKANSTANSTNVSVNGLDFDSEDPVSEFINGETVDEYDDTINYLLQNNKNDYLEKLNAFKSKTPDTQLKIYSNDFYLNGGIPPGDEFLTYRPLIDLKRFPPDLLIIIFENSPQLGNLRDVFSFRLNELDSLQYSNREASPFVKQLRSYLPRWIGQPVLYDRFPSKEGPKIAFQLLELDYPTLPPEKKIQGRSQRKIKRLPVLESSIKLTSHNMLRVSKILGYLTEKFESRTNEMKEKIPAIDWLVLECRGQELHPGMTLQTIKTKIWKLSSDIELRFRRKFDK